MQFNIQKSGSVPLHLQLLDELRHFIMTGLVKPNERLPGEWELSNELDISRATIQKAWQSAEEEGLIYRIPGKGTFIGEPRPKNALAQLVTLVVPDFRGTFAVHMLSGVERVLRRRGYHVQLASTEYTLQEENRILRQSQADGVCGVILWGVNPAPKMHVMQQTYYIAERQTEHTKGHDAVDHIDLLDAVVAVIGLRVNQRWFEQPNGVPMAQRFDRSLADLREVAYFEHETDILKPVGIINPALRGESNEKLPWLMPVM
jgi:DNA-binding transcriptional regulator YhcF (GntR family)